MWRFQKTKGLLALLCFALLSQTARSQEMAYPQDFMQNLLKTEQQMKDDGFTGQLLPGDQCIRSCEDNAEALYCYYSFRVELYPVPTAACRTCMPNNTNQLSGQPLCECVIGDGVEKTAIVTNRMLPGPSIQVCLRDKLIIDVHNDAEGVEVTNHWHGLFQKGYQYYDGVPFLTQCPIQSGTTFRYHFAANNPGTHFYHSHMSVYMVDGQYGSLIIRSPPSMDPNYDTYDTDSPKHVILVSDAFHSISTERFPGSLVYNSGQAAENFLINGKGIYTGNERQALFTPPLEVFTVKPGKRYRFRLICAFSTVCLAYLSIENHSLNVIATDGLDLNSTEVDAIVVAAGERYDFVLHANQDNGCYWITLRGLGECAERKIIQYAIICYDGSSINNMSSRPEYDSQPDAGITRVLNPIIPKTCNVSDGEFCIPDLQSLEEQDSRLLQKQADHQFILRFGFHNFSTNAEKTLFEPGSYKKFWVAPDEDHLTSIVERISYAAPESPPLSQDEIRDTLCSGPDLAQCGDPCYCANYYTVETNSVVEIVLIDEVHIPMLSHPFHLHGHAFAVLQSGWIGRNFTQADISELMNQHVEKLEKGEYRNNLALKDTLVVPESGYVIIRFIADNPGWWFFHCHFAWHTATGMNIAIQVGTDDELPDKPPNFPTCGSWKPSPTFEI